MRCLGPPSISLSADTSTTLSISLTATKNSGTRSSRESPPPGRPGRSYHGLTIPGRLLDSSGKESSSLDSKGTTTSLPPSPPLLSPGGGQELPRGDKSKES